jgi:hypothetical protein
MKPIPLLLAAATLMAPGLGSQTQTPKLFLIPNPNPGPIANNYPFAGPIMRYQQWYAPGEWKAMGAPQHPVRVRDLEFRAGSPGGQAGATVDMELAIANGPEFAPSQVFESNLVAGRVTAPRTVRTLGTATPGSYPMKVTLPSDFVWDGVSGVVVDVKIWGNGRGNQPFNFDLEATASASGRLTRLYTVNNPSATFADQFQPGWGVTTRFTYYEGVTLPYAQGCPGAGNFVPVASTGGGLPLPGNANWAHVVTRAASQRPAALVLGSSNQTWGQVQLPLDLAIIGANGCWLVAEPLIALSAMTVGGGAGAGQATVPVPIPPVTIFIGQSLYTQWFVGDPLAANGLLSASGGLWTIAGG